MCMVAVNDVLIKEAVATQTIDANYTNETLSKIFEEMLSERINKNKRFGSLKYRGSKIWEGNLDEMRNCR